MSKCNLSITRSKKLSAPLKKKKDLTKNKFDVITFYVTVTECFNFFLATNDQILIFFRIEFVRYFFKLPIVFMCSHFENERKQNVFQNNSIKWIKWRTVSKRKICSRDLVVLNYIKPFYQTLFYALNQPVFAQLTMS